MRVLLDEEIMMIKARRGDCWKYKASSSYHKHVAVIISPHSSAVGTGLSSLSSLIGAQTHRKPSASLPVRC